MKVETSSGLKRSQEDKELGSWFGELLPIASSMDNCQPQQAIEPGRKVPETNGKEVNPEEVMMMMMLAKKRRVLKVLRRGIKWKKKIYTYTSQT